MLFRSSGETPDSESETEKDPSDNQPSPSALQAGDSANVVDETFPDSDNNALDNKEKSQDPFVVSDETERRNAQGQSQMAYVASGIPEGDTRKAHKKAGNVKLVLLSLLALASIASAFVAGLYLGGKNERSVPASKVVVVKKADRKSVV